MVADVSITASTADVVNMVQAKAAQLQAMLVLITHGGPDSFHNFNQVSAATRSTYLWACADLAREVSALADTIPLV